MMIDTIFSTLKNTLKVTFFYFLSFTALFAKTPLKGDVSGKTLEILGSPYIVTEDIFISSGHKTIIKPGTVILFHSFTGMKVSGNLIVEGTIENPVVFTSVNDGAYNKDSEQLPKEFDWNGISIEDSASEIKMRNFELHYSVYGIKSHIKDIVLVNALFENNGQFNFTINDEIMMVKDKISYSYDALQAKRELIKKSRPKWKLPVQIGLGAIAAAGIGLAVAGDINADKYQQKYLEQGSSGDALSYRDKRDAAIKMKNTGIITAITSGACVTITIFIKGH